MKKQLRVGILGCARIAEKYAIAALRAVPSIEVLAIASRDLEKARAWGAKFAIEPETYESLVARDDIDAVYSPLPVGLQETWAIAAMERGKHVICEKSITHSLESAQRMTTVSQERNVALYENFVPEFHPQHVRIRDMIDRGLIGTPHLFTGFYGFPPFPLEDIRYRADLKGGALNDAGCYTVFMARKLFAAEPIAVTCSLDSGGREVDTEGTALLEFESGSALVSFGFDNVYRNTYEIWGSKGIVRSLRAYALPPDVAPPVELVTNDGTGEHIEQITVSAADQFARSFEYFGTAALQGDAEALVSMREKILKQAAVLEAMRISAQNGKRVSIR